MPSILPHTVKPCSSELDNRVLRDTTRLAEFIQQAQNRIHLVGVKDAEQDPKRAQPLWRLRVSATQETLYHQKNIHIASSWFWRRYGGRVKYRGKNKCVEV